MRSVWNNRTERGGSTIVTAVVWTTPEAFAAAREAASAWRAARGFNPRELLARLGVEADFGEFQRIAV